MLSEKLKAYIEILVLTAIIGLITVVLLKVATRGEKELADCRYHCDHKMYICKNEYLTQDEKNRKGSLELCEIQSHICEYDCIEKKQKEK